MPEGTAERQHVPEELESVQALPPSQSERRRSAPEEEEQEAIRKKPERKTYQIQKHFGPKALQAAAAAARDAASFQVKTSQAKKIGEDMKKTHFDLTNISADAITRAQAMESTYRRLFVWSETHGRLNPATSFTIVNLPTASV